jgi:hypothetical protein
MQPPDLPYIGSSLRLAAFGSVVAAGLTLAGCAEGLELEALREAVSADAQGALGPAPGGPGYFVAIHAEPYPSTDHIQDELEVLRKLVEMADEDGIKLTLMFSVQWAAFFDHRPQDKAMVLSWKDRGHEISSHRHSAYAGLLFDGYSDLRPKRVAELQGVDLDALKLRGDLGDWQQVMEGFDPAIASGCSNDEMDRRVLPAMVRVDTCGGFSNFRQPGAMAIYHSVESGINDFVVVGTPADGLERRWLGHAPLLDEEQLAGAMEAFAHLPERSIYGVVAHPEQAAYLIEWFEHVREHSSPARSYTVQEIVRKRLLPEYRLDPELVNMVVEPGLPGEGGL